MNAYLFDIDSQKNIKAYKNELTADVNDKGVLDIDTVKGCTAGMGAYKNTGCYGTCYANKIAKFRGIDFTKSVSRKVYSFAHARKIENAVKNAPEGFFRVGTMGDPCHDWEHTVNIIEWLSQYAVPILVTKHWYKASENQMNRLIKCGTILNTSLSALDTNAQLKHRKNEHEKYKKLGGHAVARIVSCDFNENNEIGKKMLEIQNSLFKLTPIIDNPLRVSFSHELVKSGAILLTMAFDINSKRTISIKNKDVYLGKCADCQDKCGLSSVNDGAPLLMSGQMKLFKETK